LDLLRNAVVAESLCDHEDATHGCGVASSLMDALFKTQLRNDVEKIDEMEPLVLRYQELAQAQSRKEGRTTYLDLASLYYTARLHEVQGLLEIKDTHRCRVLQ